VQGDILGPCGGWWKLGGGDVVAASWWQGVSEFQEPDAGSGSYVCYFESWCGSEYVGMDEVSKWVSSLRGLGAEQCLPL